MREVSDRQSRQPRSQQPSSSRPGPASVHTSGVQAASLDEIQRQMEKLFDHLASSKRPMAVFSSDHWHPLVDVCETDEAVMVLVELAGVDPNGVKLIADGENLLIQGERTLGRRACRHVYHQIEINFGSFQRIVRLPAPVNPDEAQAIYSNGFLEIVLPRARELRAHKVIIKPS